MTAPAVRSERGPPVEDINRSKNSSPKAEMIRTRFLILNVTISVRAQIKSVTKNMKLLIRFSASL